MSPATSSGFSWNGPGVTGTALGMSFWIPATAIASGWPGAGVAVALAAAFAILMSAWVLWLCRRRIGAFRGLTILLAIGFIVTFLFLLAAHLLELRLIADWPGGKRLSPLRCTWFLLLYPVLAAWLWFQNNQMRNSESEGAPNGASRRC
jgi:hypothetical protein